MFKIYLGCSLTHAPDEFRASIDTLKTKLREKYEVFDFVGLTNGTSRDVYLQDTDNVVKCDLFLAECSFPSIGLGYELGIALTLNKPVLAVAREEARVSRLVLGIDKPGYSFARYKDWQEILMMVDEKAQNFSV